MEEAKRFEQLCVWQGTTLSDKTSEDLVAFFKEEGFTIKFECEVTTLASVERNEEGGRNDLLFYIAADEIGKFSIFRLGYGIRWWEDVVSYNDNAYQYTQEILDKYPAKW